MARTPLKVPSPEETLRSARPSSLLVEPRGPFEESSKADSSSRVSSAGIGLLTTEIRLLAGPVSA
jgi:hypothetical protein